MDLKNRWNADDGRQYLSAILRFLRGESDFPDKLMEILYDSNGVKRLDCRCICLSDLYIEDIELANFDFSGSIFKRCKFERVNLFSSLLENVNFKDVSFVKCILTGSSCANAIFENIKMEHCHLDSSNLKNTTFSNSFLTDVNFSYSDLTFASMDNTTVSNPDLYNAKGANF